MTLQIFIEFILKSFSLFIIASFPFTTNALKKYFYVFSIINFIALSSIVLLGMVDAIGYMRFGYAMLPTLLASLFFMRDRNKILCSFVGISSFFMIFIFGSRGPLIAVIIFVGILILADKEMEWLKKLAILFVLCIGTYYLLFANVLLKLLDFLYFEAGFQTYSIIKLKIMLEEGLIEASSGRDYYYEKFIHEILGSPVLGNGIGITHELWGVTPHNIFIQLLIESGFLGIMLAALLTGIIMASLFSLRKVENELFLLLALIFSVSFGRLLVSSDLWLRPELWMFVSMTMNASLMNKKRIIINHNLNKKIPKEV